MIFIEPEQNSKSRRQLFMSAEYWRPMAGGSGFVIKSILDLTPLPVAPVNGS